VVPAVSDCDGTGRLQQTVSETITPSTGDLCTDGGGVSVGVNFFARCYSLAAEGCSGPRIVTGARVGIEIVQDAAQTITVNLYRDPGCLTGTPGTGAQVQIASSTLFLTPAMTGTVQPVPLDTMGEEIGVNEALLIEWVLPPSLGFQTAFPGANSGGQSTPGFIKTSDCSVPNYIIFNTIGLPNLHLVLSLETIAATASPTDSPTRNPTDSPTRNPTDSPTPAPSNVCDQTCEGNSEKTPMFVMKLGQCKSACVPDAAVASKEKFGWLCGVCP
jgi:hypothetical protein